MNRMDVTPEAPGSIGERNPTQSGPSCPLPFENYPRISMAHGGGGRLTRDLIEGLVVPNLSNPLLEKLGDGAVFNAPGEKLAFTTDSFVVQPLFFPGGNIGELAVFGTVNDLAMCGARPLYLSLSMILEEGLLGETLQSVVEAIGSAAAEAGVAVVTGDTKVVERRVPEGEEPGLFLNTAGVGVIEAKEPLGTDKVRFGDKLVVSGDIGRHGMAIMASREGLEFSTTIESDCACLFPAVDALQKKGIRVRCMRDLTRGGLATATIEIGTSAGQQILLVAEALVIREDVRVAGEILGLDPLYVANEGRFLAVIDPEDADEAVEILREHPGGEHAAVVGEVEKGSGGAVIENAFGVRRTLAMLSGEQLPRIC